MWINHTSDSQSNRTDHKWFQNGCNKYVYPIHFVVYCYINNSLYSDWKYARILVCRHFLFWDVNSLEEWSSRKTVSSEERWRPRTNIQVYFHATWRLSSLLLFKYFCNVWIKFLWTIYCLGMFNFQCPKVWLGKQTNMSLLSSPIKF